MEAWLIIGIIVLIAIIVGVFFLIKILIKAIMAAIIIFIIALLVVGGFVALDVKDFKQNFPESDKLLLLEDNGILIAGMFGKLQETSNTHFLNNEEIEELQGFYINKDFESMLGENYKLMIFKKEAFNSISIEVLGQEYPGDIILNALESNDPINVMVNYQLQELNLPAGTADILAQELKASFNNPDTSELKGILFAILFLKYNENEILPLVKEYKSGNLIVYKETAMFKVIKYMPWSIISRAKGIFMSRAADTKDQLKEKITDKVTN